MDIDDFPTVKIGLMGAINNCFNSMGVDDFQTFVLPL